MTHRIQSPIRRGDRRAPAPSISDPEVNGADAVETSSELFERLYAELRRIALAQMVHLKPGQTLQATALVHEAFLKMASTQWTSEKAFFVTAAMAMRCIVLDNLKAKRRAKRGGGLATITLHGADIVDESIQTPQAILLFEEITKRLEELDPDLRDLVLLRHYAGLTLPQISRICNVPLRTLERRWSLIRAMVLREREQSDSRDASNES